jgi:hypothetical protein
MIEIDGKWYEKCGDCGEPVVKREVSTLSRLCDECWERRGWLVDNAGKYWKDGTFERIQRDMRNHNGKAKGKIIKLQKALREESLIAYSIDNYSDLED